MNHKDYVHYHIGFSKNKWIIFFNYFLGFFICLGNGFLTIIVLVVILNLITEETLPQSVLFTSTIIIGIIYFYYMIKSVHTEKTSYKIYEDRIEFFNERTPTIVDVIPFSEIDQVRYEDEFGDMRGTNVPRHWFMYCYFKEGYQAKSKKIKKDRLMLLLSNDQKTRIDDIITILSHFKQKKKQVYISTKYSEINEALNLRNWTAPPVIL